MANGIATRVIHAGQPNDPLTGAATFPIYQTSTFAQAEIGGDPDYCYTRTGNPSREALEQNLASLESARHALAFASGMSAINNVLNLLSTGDHVVACADLYGGAYRIFTKLYAKFGIEFTFVDTTDPDRVRDALAHNTRIVWLETPSNPLLRVTDIRACAALAKTVGALTVVDNTFATPLLQRPLALGADVVVHSTTKYLNGHADVLGGAVVTDSDELHEQLRFFQNTVGSVPAPMDCFLVLRGIKTLPLRVKQHCAGAQRVAEYLCNHPAVQRVYYPGLADHPGHDVARRQATDFGGIVSFELEDDIEVAKTFSRNCRLWTLAESLGGPKSLFCHPPTMTHAAVEPEVRRQNGIRDGLIRLSVGLEEIDDLIADLDRALAAVHSRGGAVKVVGTTP
ncbi:MAG: PLP-dependent transferase [bacterium]|nr:PLP-dependent transferase [bacterium]